MTTIAPYHDKEEWLLERQSGLGGSDASAIAGLNPYRTPLDVYHEKISDLEPDDPNWRMEWGLIAEPIAADLYAKKTGRAIRRQPLRRHSEYEFLIANVDRQIMAGTADVTSPGALEIKCPGIGHFSKIKAHGLPDYAVLQLQHYLGVLDYSWGSFAIFNSESGPPIHFDMSADQELIENLFERERDFWLNHVVPRIPPPEIIDADNLNIPQIEGDVITIDEPEWREAARDLQDAVQLKKTAMELEKYSKEILQKLMDDLGADAVEIPDLARFYYRTHDGRTSWKKTAEKLAMESGLPLSQFLEVGKPYRSFRSYFMRRGEE